KEDSVLHSLLQCERYCATGQCCIVSTNRQEGLPSCSISSMEECQSQSAFTMVTSFAQGVNMPRSQPQNIHVPGGCMECGGAVALRQEVTLLKNNESLHTDNNSTQIARLLQALRTLHESGWLHGFAKSYGVHIMVAHNLRSWLGGNRAGLHSLESEIRRITECNVALPYWDFTTHSMNLSESPIWMMFPKDLYDEPTSLIFRHILPNVKVGAITDIVKILASPDFESFSEALWQQYSQVIAAIGGTIASLNGPFDPVFFLLGGYMDKLWTTWQIRHPNLQPHYAKTTILRPFR
ncbi:unnamed protein product, partial [Meganyctiphanes norvegica]